MKHTEDSVNEKSNSVVNSKKSFFKSAKFKIASLTVVIALFLTAIGGAVFAHKEFRDGPHGFLLAKLAKKLDLTESQQQQVDRMREEIKSKFESRRENGDALMKEFADEFKKDNLDRTKLRELNDKRKQNEQEMESFMMDKLIEFHDMLTPAQRVKASELMNEMKNKFHERGKHDKDNDVKFKERQN